MNLQTRGFRLLPQRRAPPSTLLRTDTPRPVISQSVRKSCTHIQLWACLFLIRDASMTRLSQIFITQDCHPRRSEQPIVPGGSAVGACGQDAPFYFSSAQGLSGYEDTYVPTQADPEPLSSNNATYLPPSDSHLTPYVPARNTTYDRAPIDLLADQQFPPSTGLSTPDYEGSAFLFPPADQHHFQGPLPNATPECNNDPYSGGEQSFLDPDGTDGSYSRVMGSSLPLTTGQSTLMVDHKLNARRHTVASVSGLASGVGSGEMMDLPAGLPLVDGAGSQTPKKRKPVTTPDSPREVKRTRHRRLQRLVSRGPVPVGVVQSRSALK